MAVRSVSTALAGDVLAAILTGQAITLGSTLTVALSTAVPDNEGVGLTRPDGGGYADVTIDRSASAWTPGDRRWTNTAALTFPTPTASWGTVVAYAVLAGDTFLFAEPLASAHTVATGSVVSFPAGTIGLSA